MKKLSIIAALLFAFGTVTFAQQKAGKETKKTEKKETKKAEKKETKKAGAKKAEKKESKKAADKK